MNIVISSLPFIASAAESMDRRNNAKSKLVWAMRNSVIWAANSVLTAKEHDDQERITETQNRLHTLQVLSKEFQEALWFEIGEVEVRLHLGLERVQDVHEQAISRARQDVLRTRSPKRFQEFYKKASARIIEQNEQRKARVADIVDICNCDASGQYDENLVENDLERITGKIAEVSEIIYNDAEQIMAGSFVPATYDKYKAFKEAAVQMLGVLGISEHDLLKRNAKLYQLLDAEVDAQRASDAELEEAMKSEIAAMAVPQTSDTRTPRRRIVRGDQAAQS